MRWCQSLRSSSFSSRVMITVVWMRDRVDGRVDGRHNNAWRHTDNTRRSDLLGWLDQGLSAMLQTG